MPVLRRLALPLAPAMAIALAAPLAATAATTAVVVDDPKDDVVVDGGVMSDEAYAAVDLDDVSVTNVQGSVLEIDWEVWDSSPGQAATVTYEATMKVKHRKPKGKKKRPRGYTVGVTLLSHDPLDPLRITSTKSGKVKSVVCDEATSEVDGNYHVIVTVPLSCIGSRKAESATITHLITGIDSVSGARGRDGAKTGPVSLARGRL